VRVVVIPCDRRLAGTGAPSQHRRPDRAPKRPTRPLFAQKQRTNPGQWPDTTAPAPGFPATGRRVASTPL